MLIERRLLTQPVPRQSPAAINRAAISRTSPSSADIRAKSRLSREWLVVVVECRAGCGVRAGAATCSLQHSRHQTAENPENRATSRRAAKARFPPPGPCPFPRKAKRPPEGGGRAPSPLAAGALVVPQSHPRPCARPPRAPWNARFGRCGGLRETARTGGCGSDRTSKHWRFGGGSYSCWQIADCALGERLCRSQLAALTPS
jgi:hypothetical protein